MTAFSPLISSTLLECPLSYGNSDLNVRHRAVGWAIFNIPGIGTNHYVHGVTSGWSVKPALQVQSGLPCSAGTSPIPPAPCTANGGLVANNSRLSGTSVTYIPRSDATPSYPGDISLDLRLQNDFSLPSATASSSSASPYNVANHQNVTGINTTAYSIGVSTVPATAAGGNPIQQLVCSPFFFSQNRILR